MTVHAEKNYLHIRTVNRKTYKKLLKLIALLFKVSQLTSEKFVIYIGGER